MEKMTVIKTLTTFFNTGEGKRPAARWAAELKALTPEQRTELAVLAAAAMGTELS